MIDTIKAPKAQSVIPQSFIAERAMLRPRNSAIFVSTFRSRVSIPSIFVLIGVVSFLISSCTIKRILSRSASSSTPIAGIAMAHNSIENSKIVFMRCSSSSFFIPLLRWEGGRNGVRLRVLAVPPTTGFKSISDRKKKSSLSSGQSIQPEVFRVGLEGDFSAFKVASEG